MLAKDVILLSIKSYIEARKKAGESKVVMDVDLIYYISNIIAKVIEEEEGKKINISKDMVRKVLNQLAKEDKLRKVVDKNKAFYIALEPLQVEIKSTKELNIPLNGEISDEDLAYYSEVLEIE